MSVAAWLLGVVLGKGSKRLEDLGVEELVDIAGLDKVLAGEEPVWLFKHSTTCPISASGYRQVASYVAGAGAGAPPVYLVKVIESRPVSNEIAARLGVRHESPQVLLVKGGAVVWHASHGGIAAGAMRGAIG